MNTLSKEDIITGNQFKNICEDFLDETKNILDLSKKPKIIFVKTDLVKNFFFQTQYLSTIKWPFVLVTHNADNGITRTNSSEILNHPHLVKWFGMNCEVNDPKLVPIPIGIANENWPHGNKETLIQVANQNIPKCNRAYANFVIRRDRQKVKNIVDTYTFVDQQKGLPFKEYLESLSKYKFTISPPGNGVDCHRHWESLYLKTIPIIINDVCTEQFTKNLPIISLDSYENLTLDKLNNLAEKLNFDYAQTKFSYWKKLILS